MCVCVCVRDFFNLPFCYWALHFPSSCLASLHASFRPSSLSLDSSLPQVFPLINYAVVGCFHSTFRHWTHASHQCWFSLINWYITPLVVVIVEENSIHYGRHGELISNSQQIVTLAGQGRKAIAESHALAPIYQRGGGGGKLCWSVKRLLT